VRFGYDYILRPNLLNHFNAGFSRRYRQEFSGIGSYGGNWPSKLGLKGVMDTTFPIFDFDYEDRASIPSDGANQFYDNTYQYNDTVSWQHGRNSFNFGVETRLQQFNIDILTAHRDNSTSAPVQQAMRTIQNPDLHLPVSISGLLQVQK